MAVSKDYISKICQMKADDEKSNEKKAFRLKNLICFESEITEEE